MLLAISVVVVVENDVDRCDIRLLAGGAKAVVDVETRTITAIAASSMRLDKFWIVIMIVFFCRILPGCMDEKYILYILELIHVLVCLSFDVSLFACLLY